MLLGKELIIIPSQSSRRLGVFLVFFIPKAIRGLSSSPWACGCSALDDLEMGEPRNVLEPRTPSVSPRLCFGLSSVQLDGPQPWAQLRWQGVDVTVWVGWLLPNLPWLISPTGIISGCHWWNHAALPSQTSSGLQELFISVTRKQIQLFPPFSGHNFPIRFSLFVIPSFE